MLTIIQSLKNYNKYFNKKAQFQPDCNLRVSKMGNTKGYIPSYGELTADDYKKLGLKSGLEIHQQLMTEKKLFCRCPAGRYEKTYDAEILRHMRPTLSELGEYDATALMEFKTKKQVIYQLHKDTVCTYEMDDAPPFALNREALHKSIVLALQFYCNIVGEIHITRKQYLDGSIPAGFQRTTIIGTDGYIPYDGRKIRVIQFALEEDACREVKDEGHYIYYRTDRLSTPLIEVVTDAQMHTPWDVAGVGEAIRRITRITGLMRRGAGSGRQDVNVSIAGGQRCEIKGVQSIKYIPSLVHYEALRQKALLEIREMLLNKGLKPETLKTSSCDITETMRKTAFEPVREAIQNGAVATAVKLPLFREALIYHTGPRFNFAKEISERIRVIACIDKQPNMLYRDWIGLQIPGHKWSRIENLLKASDDDGIIVVWGTKEDVATAVGEIKIRAKEALVGIPLETRQANSDGGTGFERMLPGPDRMYPDTDMPPIAINEEDIESARKEVVISPFEWQNRLEKAGAPKQFIQPLIKMSKAALAEKTLLNLEMPKGFTAYLLSGYIRHLKRKGHAIENISDDSLYALFEAASTGRVVPGALAALILNVIANGGEPNGELSKEQYRPMSETEARQQVDKLLKKLEKPKSNNPEAKKRYFAGKIIENLENRIDAKWLTCESGLL